MITQATNVNGIHLADLAGADLDDWIRLKQYHPKRFDELIRYVESDDKTDPTFDQWQREQAEANSEAKRAHDAFFSDGMTYRSI